MATKAPRSFRRRAKKPRPISNEHEIQMYLHCAMCLAELQAKVEAGDGPQSPREYASLEIGWTTVGLQVWCKRHEVNVVHVDFDSRKLPANTSRPDDPVGPTD